MRQRPRHRVTRHALRAALPTPRVVLDDAALQHRPIRLEQLPDGLKAELVETAERGQVRGHERRVVQVEVFRQMVSVRTSILGRPRPLSRYRHANARYTLNCEEPD